MNSKRAVWACLLASTGVPLAAVAADATFTNEAAFVAAAGSTQLESFETLAGVVRGSAPVLAPLFTVTALTAPLGVQSAANTPDNGFGASATDGTRYLSVYLPNQPQGTLRFDLANPSTVFGFNIMDVGEVDGTVSIRTNSGAFASGVVLATYPPTFGDGNVQYFGLMQTLPFTQVFITVTGLDDAYAIDKVSVNSVPEPATALLLMGGLVAVRRLAMGRNRS